MQKVWPLGWSEGKDGEHVRLIAGKHVEDDNRLGVVLAVLVEHAWALGTKGALAGLDVNGDAQDRGEPERYSVQVAVLLAPGVLSQNVVDL